MPQPRILIVEEDPAAARAMAQMLDAGGYEPLGPATSCREALEAAEACRPDLAVCNLTLPGVCDGVDTAALLREGRGVPAILMWPGHPVPAGCLSKSTHRANLIYQLFSAYYEKMLPAGPHPFQPVAPRRAKRLYVSYTWDAE